MWLLLSGGRPVPTLTSTTNDAVPDRQPNRRFPRGASSRRPKGAEWDRSVILTPFGSRGFFCGSSGSRASRPRTGVAHGAGTGSRAPCPTRFAVTLRLFGLWPETDQQSPVTGAMLVTLPHPLRLAPCPPTPPRNSSANSRHGPARWPDRPPPRQSFAAALWTLTGGTAAAR